MMRNMRKPQLPRLAPNAFTRTPVATAPRSISCALVSI